MRLLIINFAMDENDPALAWQCDVADGLAEHCQSVVVLTHRPGHFRPRPNLEVRSFSSRPFGVPSRAGGQWLHNFSIWRLCRNRKIDACFIHMAHEWAYRLAPALKWTRTPSLLWYAHGSVTNSLKRAHRCVDGIVTSTPEGFRIPSKKLRTIGQGINLQRFAPPPPAANKNDVLYVGRISRRKRLGSLIESMQCLRRIQPESNIRLKIVGPTLTPDDQDYERELRQRATVCAPDTCFLGPHKQNDISALYRSAFLHLNVSQTGSLDKTILESLACGCPVLTSNPASFDLLSEYPELQLGEVSPQVIATRILKLHARRDAYDPQSLRQLVAKHHDLDSYVQKIVSTLRELS
ncbi:MAG: glycosyltransferase family 4 protein [Planctomycetaceae bacterium]